MLAPSRILRRELTRLDFLPVNFFFYEQVDGWARGAHIMVNTPLPQATMSVINKGERNVVPSMTTCGMLWAPMTTK